MNENINNQTTEIREESMFTLNYCLAQIAKIHSETAYIRDVISELAAVRSDGPGDIGAQGKAMALGEVVKCRETTNQKLLEFYMRMYDDLKTTTVDVLSVAHKELSNISALIADYCCEDDAGVRLVQIAEMIKDLAEKAMKN